MAVQPGEGLRCGVMSQIRVIPTLRVSMRRAFE